MKRVSIINNVTGQMFGAEFSNDIEMQAWLDMCIDKDYFGKKERTKDTASLTADELLLTPVSTTVRQVSRIALRLVDGQPVPTGNLVQQLIDGVLVETVEYQTEEVLEDIPQTTLPCEYSISILDLEQDAEYLLEQCYRARKAEYGTVESQLDEIYHDIEAWKARLAAIKLAVPKP